MIAGVVAGALVALVIALMADINLQYGAPWATTHTLTAEVSDADGMAAGSDVRIAGRAAGQVVSVQAAGDHANIVFTVDAADWPLPADTTLNVRLATLLGQKYVQLNPGHSSQDFADNAVIGLASTGPVVDFDQVLDAFNAPTRAALTSLLRTLGGAVAGQQATLQRLIPNLSNLAVVSQVPTQELAARNAEFNAILVNLGITANQLNASRNDLAGVVKNLNTITAALSSNGGRALTSFITNTDTLTQTTNAVLRGGDAAALRNGLQKVGSLATDMNTLFGALIPQTTSVSQPVAGAEPSDLVNGNGGIPANSAIDLIYEAGNASSQGYGSTNFGTAASPDFQGNFFLRQNVAAFDNCASATPPCVWGQHATASQPLPLQPVAHTPIVASPVVPPTVEPAEPMCAVLSCPSGGSLCSSNTAGSCPSPSPLATAPTSTSTAVLTLEAFTIPVSAPTAGIGEDVWGTPLHMRYR